MVLVTEHQLSVSRACSIVRFSRAACYRTPRPQLEVDAEVIAALPQMVADARKDRPGLRIETLHWGQLKVPEYRVAAEGLMAGVAQGRPPGARGEGGNCRQ